MANTLDLVRARGRALGRDAYKLACGDVDRCPHNPVRDDKLNRDLGRVPTIDELRVLGHAYREELHALNAAAELASPLYSKRAAE